MSKFFVYITLVGPLAQDPRRTTPSRQKRAGWGPGFCSYGEPAGTRTQDPRLKRALLYQLSYELTSDSTSDSRLTQQMATVVAVQASFCGQKTAWFVAWQGRDTAKGGLSGAGPRVYRGHPHPLVASALLTKRGREAASC
jgi:hypothetical protein